MVADEQPTYRYLLWPFQAAVACLLCSRMTYIKKTRNTFLFFL